MATAVEKPQSEVPQEPRRKRKKKPLITTEKFLEQLEKRRGDRTLTALAEELGVSFQFLGKVIRQDVPPGPKVAAAMGYEQITAFRLKRWKRRKHAQPDTPQN